MKRECTFVQGKSNKMVTSATLLSHHVNSENSKSSISIFSHSQLQCKLCGLWWLLRHIAHPLTRRSHHSHQ